MAWKLLSRGVDALGCAAAVVAIGKSSAQIGVYIRTIDMNRSVVIGLVMIGASVCGEATTAQKTPHHDLTVTARRYAFEPASLEVHKGDLIRITFRTADIPHSFVIEAYRISKRTAPGDTVTFEFLADRTGRFPYYCSLTLEDGCRSMKGELVVQPDGLPEITRSPSNREALLTRIGETRRR